MSTTQYHFKQNNILQQFRIPVISLLAVAAAVGEADFVAILVVAVLDVVVVVVAAVVLLLHRRVVLQRLGIESGTARFLLGFLLGFHGVAHPSEAAPKAARITTRYNKGAQCR